MRVKGDNSPPGAYTVETQPGKPGFVCVRLYENAQQVTEETHWVYDEYQLVVPARDDLDADIEAHLDEWIATAQSLEVDGRASAVVDMKEALDILLGVNTDE